MPLKSDGSMKFGSMELTIGSAAGGVGGTAYIADNVSLTRATAQVLQTDEVGEPIKRRVYKNDVDKFTADLQFPSDSAVPPSIGWETTVTFDSTTGAEIYYVDTLGVSYTKDGETKMSVGFAEKLN